MGKKPAAIRRDGYPIGGVISERCLQFAKLTARRIARRAAKEFACDSCSDRDQNMVTLCLKILYILVSSSLELLATRECMGVMVRALSVLSLL